MGIYDYSVNAIDEDMIAVEIKEVDWETIQERLDFLEALEQAGVDNWEGYYLAQEIMYGEED